MIWFILEEQKEKLRKPRGPEANLKAWETRRKKNQLSE